MIDTQIHFLENIRIETPSKKAMSRLGYSKTKTILDEKTKILIDKVFSKTVSLCVCRGVYRFLKIIGKTDTEIVLQDGLTLKSRDIAKLFSNSDYLVFMASTVGSDVTEKISSLIKNEEASEAVIMDAAASQIADLALTQVNNFLKKTVISSGYALSKRRFSPGYGDFSLENQKYIFETLQLEKLGLELTQSFQLIPEKSVTAIAGVEPRQ